ncbi:MAG: hypothetical protein AAGH92_07015, partial [Planctomycetota bacterium]
MTQRVSIVLVLAGLTLPASAAPGDVLFFDDFEGGASAANYFLVADTSRPPGTTGNAASDSFDAAFAYTDLGQAGDVRSGTGGRFLTEDALTAFVNGVIVNGSVPISITYDLYMDPSSSGSTEYNFVGVGNVTAPFQHYLRGSLIGNEETQGVFAGGLTDSDTAGSGDYVLLESAGGVASPIDLFDGDATGNAQDGTSFADILPAGTPGPSGESVPARILQHRWVSVEFLIDGNAVSYFYDDQLIATATSSTNAVGRLGIGIGDPFPSSNQGMRVPPTADTSVIIDNVRITEVPEPATASLLALSAAALLR